MLVYPQHNLQTMSKEYVMSKPFTSYWFVCSACDASHEIVTKQSLPQCFAPKCPCGALGTLTLCQTALAKEATRQNYIA